MSTSPKVKGIYTIKKCCENLLYGEHILFIFLGTKIHYHESINMWTGHNQTSYVTNTIITILILNGKSELYVIAFFVKDAPRDVNFDILLMTNKIEVIRTKLYISWSEINGTHTTHSSSGIITTFRKSLLIEFHISIQ